MSDTKSGYVYILSNPSMPQMYKVGKSIHGGKKRANQLYTTGVPDEFVLELEIYVDDCLHAESQAHRLLSEFRVSQNREFFRCTYAEVIGAVVRSVIHEHSLTVISIDELFEFERLQLMAKKVPS